LEKRHHRWGSAFASGVASIAALGAARAHARGLRHRVVAGALAGSLILAQAPMAWAQGGAAKPAAGADAGLSKADLAAAKKHYGDGEKKYKAGDYAGALADFKEANEIKSTPHAERYLGLCEDNLGHYQTALDWYDKFLTHVPDKLASQGDDLRKREAEIKAMPGKVHIDSTPTGASLTIDDKPASGPTPLDVDLAPGSHVVKVVSPGHLPATKPVDVAFASTQSVSVELEPEPPAAPPAPPVAAVPPAPVPAATVPPPAPEVRSVVPAIVTGGLAIAAVGVGTVFGIMALNDKSDFDKTPTTSIADNGDTHALIADMAFGVAVTFGVTSAVLFVTKDEAPTATSSTQAAKTAKAAAAKKTAVTFTPTPIVGAHTGGAGFVLRF
jgi:PEGA domain